MNKNGLISHLLSLVLLPGTVLGLIPYYLNLYLPEPTIYEEHIFLEISGYFFIVVGGILIIWTVFLFGIQGGGTLAPWNPPRRLVLSGPYRHVRNPMIIGVITVLLGLAFLLNSMFILIWAMVFFIINSIYFELMEERKLERRYGDSYVHYKNSVSRWIPNIKPYKTNNQ